MLQHQLVCWFEANIYKYSSNNCCKILTKDIGGISKRINRTYFTRSWGNPLESPIKISFIYVFHSQSFQPFAIIINFLPSGLLNRFQNVYIYCFLKVPSLIFFPQCPMLAEPAPDPTPRPGITPRHLLRHILGHITSYLMLPSIESHETYIYCSWRILSVSVLI